MVWRVEYHPRFLSEFAELPEPVQDEIAALAEALKQVGPQMKRPRSDTLNGSKHTNMKELRFEADDGVWRVAYAFDPERTGILLVAGDKSGTSQSRFYKALIKRADERFDEHLAALKAARRKK
jgi:hypothetical protein